MKTNFQTGALACATFALALLLGPATGFAGAIPTEQSPEQTQTLSANQSTFAREFDRFADASTPMPAMEILQRMTQKVNEEPVRLALALNWAKDRVSVKDTSKINSLYLLIYSDMAQRSALSVPRGSAYYMAYSKAAYQALVTFDLMFRADVARCVNPEAGAPAHALLNHRYDNLKAVEDNGTPEEMETYWKTALNYEDAAAHRKGNGEICSNAVADALAEASGEKGPERVDATFIDDAKWAPLRAKVRESAATQWRLDYESIRKAYEARKAYQDSQRAAAATAKQQAADAVAAKKAAEAEKQKADDEQAAREKQQRIDAQKREQGKYHDTFTPDTSPMPAEPGDQ